MKRLLVLAILLSGCGGAEFTQGSKEETDSGVQKLAETGGAAGAVATENGGTAPLTEEDAGAGGAAPIGTGGSLATGGSSDSGDACASVTHSNGLGQTWQDCVALGTYNETQALRACKASVAVQCIVLQYCGNPLYSMRGYDVSGAAVGDWGYGGSRGGVVAIGDIGNDCGDSVYNRTWN